MKQERSPFVADKLRQPLTRSAWHGCLVDFSLACAGADEAEQAALVRELRDLLIAAPGGRALAGTRLPRARDFEAMVSAGACASAVMAMLEHDAGYLLSRGPGSLCLASVILPGRREETSASGDTPALALAAALALALETRPTARIELAIGARPNPTLLN